MIAELILFGLLAWLAYEDYKNHKVPAFGVHALLTFGAFVFIIKMLFTSVELTLIGMGSMIMLIVGIYALNWIIKHQTADIFYQADYLALIGTSLVVPLFAFPLLIMSFGSYMMVQMVCKAWGLSTQQPFFPFILLGFLPIMFGILF
jgi:hypothetical protein